MEKITTGLNRILTPKRIAVLLGIFFALTMIPILICAPAVRATGDDLGYSSGVHDALVQGQGLIGIFNVICVSVKGVWYSWQGTWSSVALFCLQPGIWGEEWYPLTVAVALVCVLVGTGYFLFTVLRRFGLTGPFRWIAFFLAAVLIIQYMPNVRAGIFWWTSVAHYCIPYGVSMVCMGWSLRWLETGRWRYFTGILLGMTYLGGAGYPEVVLAAVWFFLLILASLAGVINHCPDGSGTRIRSLLLLIPLILEMIGFAVSAIAPGNTNRGGEGFGFSMSNVIYTLITCVKEGIVGIAQYCIDVRPLLPVLLLIAVFAYEMSKSPAGPVPSGADSRRPAPAPSPALWQPVLLTLVSLGICCIVRAPEIYAATEVSGGVPDSYWFVTMTALTVCAAGDAAWLKRFHAARKTAAGTEISETNDRTHFAPLIFVLVALFCLIMSRHLIGDTVDYTCVNFIASGALTDYDEQMTEWLEILNDPEITDAELPAMNSEQGPFMMMVPLEETGNWSNSVYENYYHKNSVICVPRE